jgi:DNA-binding response OmpR family regulator
MILVTAQSGDEVEERARRAGATAYFRKPFSPRELLAFVANLPG